MGQFLFLDVLLMLYQFGTLIVIQNINMQACGIYRIKCDMNEKKVVQHFDFHVQLASSADGQIFDMLHYLLSYPVYASSEYSRETVQLRSFARTFGARLCDKYQSVKHRLIKAFLSVKLVFSFINIFCQGLVFTHICTCTL